MSSIDPTAPHDQPALHPILSIDPTALDFYFETVIPEVPAATRQAMRAAIVRGIEDHTAAAVKRAEAEARIAENQMYLTEMERHYYPAGPGDAYIPLKQFAERIKDLGAQHQQVADDGSKP